MSRSGGILGCLGQTGAFLLAGLAVFLIPVSLLLFHVGEFISSPERVSAVFIERAINSDLLYRWLLDQDILDLMMSARDENPLALLKQLQSEEQIEITRLLLPPEWLGEQIAACFDELYCWLDSDRRQPVFTITTDELRRSMTWQKAARVVNVLVDKSPECTEDQLAALIQGYESGQGLPLACVPADPALRDYVVNSGTQMLFDSYLSLPPDLPLNEASEPGTLSEVEDLKTGWYLLTNLLARMWLVPLILLALVLILVVRSWQQLGLWWGLPAALGGLTTVLAAAFIPGMGNQVLRTIQNRTEISRFLLEGLIKPLLQDAVTRIQEQVQGGGLFLFLLGMVLFVLTSIWGRRKRAKAGQSGSDIALYDMTHDITPEPVARRPDQDDETLSGMFG